MLIVCACIRLWFTQFIFPVFKLNIRVVNGFFSFPSKPQKYYSYTNYDSRRKVNCKHFANLHKWYDYIVKLFNSNSDCLFPYVCFLEQSGVASSSWKLNGRFSKTFAITYMYHKWKSNYSIYFVVQWYLYHHKVPIRPTFQK